MAKEKKDKKPNRTNRTVKKPSVCYFTQSKTEADYKDVLVLKRFITERGKIMHQNATGLTSKHQRKLSEAVKRARYMALLPYTERHAL